MASPAGARARLSVLVLHRVLAVPDTLFPKEVDAAHFTQICRWVRSMFNVLPLDAAVRGLRAGLRRRTSSNGAPVPTARKARKTTRRFKLPASFKLLAFQDKSRSR